MGVPDVVARSAEEMADSMLLDSPLPEAEEEWKQAEEIHTGEPIVPPPPNLDFLPFSRPFYLKNFSLGPQNQEHPAGKAAAAPHVEAPLVVGASTSIAPSGGAPPLVERIKLAQENMDLVQKLLAVSNRLIEYFSLCESCSLTTDPCYYINSGAGGAGE